MCKGNCDRDSDCSTGLECFTRSKKQTVTGCKNKGKTGWNYCYNPSAVVQQQHSDRLTDHGVNPLTKFHKLGHCKGDCDSNDDCATGLECFGRTSKQKVTGCKGRGISGRDYCYRPRSPTRTPTRTPTTKTPTTKTPTSTPTREPTRTPTAHPTDPLHVDTKRLTTHGFHAHEDEDFLTHGSFGMCQGDCDSDDQCRGSMVCFKSQTKGKTVTGCEGKTKGQHDYCYQPLQLSNPKRCEEWSCTEWCAYFDQAVEDAGTYKASGCAEDGVDSCQCL
jgi:hypothetical protein